MKNIKEKIAQYVLVSFNLIESKAPVSIAEVLELKKWIAAVDTLSLEDQLENKQDILSLKLNLKTLRAEQFKIQDLQNKLNNYLQIFENETFVDESVKSLAKAIRHLEDFAAALHFSIEELSEHEKQNIEPDIGFLEFYIVVFKSKLREWIAISEQSEYASLKQFRQYLKINALREHKNNSSELDLYLKNTAEYLYQNPQWYADLKLGKAIYIPIEKTGLKFPLQISNTKKNGFELYVNLKKFGKFLKYGCYKRVKKSQMLINGLWENGTEAIVYGKMDSKEISDNIRLTQKESQSVQHLNPIYVHQIHPAAAYYHNGKFKQSFMSQWADGGDLNDVINNSALLKTMSIGKLFIMCYSMVAGLSYLHSPGVNIVHKDLHGGNFFVFTDSDGIQWTKIADFGFSLPIQNLREMGEKVSDLKKISAIWHNLLLTYAQCRGLQEKDNQTFDSLLSLENAIYQSSEENPVESHAVIERLHEILARMWTSEPDEAGWIQGKLEKHYRITLSHISKENEVDFPQQRFFSCYSSAQRLPLIDSLKRSYFSYES